MNTQNLLFIDSEVDDLQSITKIINHNTLLVIVAYINDEYIIISGQEHLELSENLINKVGIISNNQDFINNYKNIYLSKISSDYTYFIDWIFNYSDDNIFSNNYDTVIITSIPNITKLGGIFEIINNPNINYNINQENGQITFNSNNISIYDIHVQYTYNTIKFLCKIQIIIKPSIEYNLNEFTLLYSEDFTSSTPIIKPKNLMNNNGIFTINKSPFI